MASNQCALVRDTDVTTWSNGLVELSIHEVCAKFGIDVENDRRNRIFWNIQLDKTVVVTEELLDWLKYTGF